VDEFIAEKAKLKLLAKCPECDSVSSVLLKFQEAINWREDARFIGGLYRCLSCRNHYFVQTEGLLTKKRTHA
jgi:DNA-directed RNA polymerase subunit RPC12/RpoP